WAAAPRRSPSPASRSPLCGQPGQERRPYGLRSARTPTWAGRRFRSSPRARARRSGSSRPKAAAAGTSIWTATTASSLAAADRPARWSVPPMTKRIDVEIPVPDGPAAGTLHIPDGDGPWPAVLVYPDAGGYREVMRADFGDRLAGMGYVALSPDVFYRSAPWE